MLIFYVWNEFMLIILYFCIYFLSKYSLKVLEPIIIFGDRFRQLFISKIFLTAEGTIRILMVSFNGKYQHDETHTSYTYDSYD